MPSPHERRRNNVRAGFFVTVTIVLAVGTIITLSDIKKTLLTETAEYIVTFQVAQGVKNIKQGADVRVGGVSLGRVEAVTPQFVGHGDAFELIDVQFSLNGDVTLYENAQVVIGSALIGAEAWLTITSVGDPALGTPAGNRLVGQSFPGIIGALMGPQNAGKADEVIDNFVETSRNVREFSDAMPGWAEKVSVVMEWADTLPDTLDGVFEEGRLLFANTRAVVDDNRPSIDTIVENVKDASGDVKAISSTIRTDTMERVHKFLDNGNQAVEAAAVTLEKIKTDYDGWATDIDETLAAARLTGQQLKLTSIEVRRSPWKLLYRPDREEMEHELLYEAARSFALAGSDLKAASASANRLLTNHSEELDEPTVKELRSFLGDSLENYQKAQQRLVSVLLDE